MLAQAQRDLTAEQVSASHIILQISVKGKLEINILLLLSKGWGGDPRSWTVWFTWHCDLHGCQDDFGEELVKGCQTLIQTAEKNELFFPYQVILMPLVLSSNIFLAWTFLFVCFCQWLPLLLQFSKILFPKHLWQTKKLTSGPNIQIAIITVEPAVQQFSRESEAFGSLFWRESVYVSWVF